MRKGLIIVVVIALVATVGFWIVGKSQPEGASVATVATGQTLPGIPERSIPVEVVRVSRGDIIQETTFNVTYAPNSAVPIIAKVAGTVDRVLVKVGDTVKKGQTLFIIDDRQYTLQVKQAEAAYEAAKANLALAEKGASEEEVEQAEAAVLQAEAGLIGARKGLENAEKMLADRTQFKQAVQSAESQVELAKSQLEAARAGVAQAKSAYENAAAEYNRMQELYNKQMISRQQLDGIRLQYESAKAGYEAAVERLNQAEIGLKAATDALDLAKESYDDPRAMIAQVDSARTQVEVAEAAYQAALARLAMVKKGASEEQLAAIRAQVKQAEAALELARMQLEYTRVTAPIAGQIAQLNVEAGSMAAPGTPAGVITDLSTMKAKAVIPESYINKLSLGQEVVLTANAIPGVTFVGKISSISPMADQQTRQFPIEISVANPDRQLKAGMFGTVSITTGKASDVLIIPVSTVLYRLGQPYVMIVSDGRAKEQPVELGLSDNEYVEVVAGLSEDSVVISKGQHQVQNGSLVEVK
ncbi:MAG: efflux RND transporter periplasmic adaptor subunit [Firmicutes bacterium]|nr:efflux RND transporter periplasmic adaptor subunit [Bacillota bacterium]